MGGRYYLTGVQLGILMSNLDEKERMKILNEIMNNQYLGDTSRELDLSELKQDTKK